MTDLSELKRLAEAAKRASDDFDACPLPGAARRVRETLQELHELCYGGNILYLIKRVEEAEGEAERLAIPVAIIEQKAHARGVAEGLERAAKRLEREAAATMDDVVPNDVEGERQLMFAAGVLLSEAEAIRSTGMEDILREQAEVRVLRPAKPAAIRKGE